MFKVFTRKTKIPNIQVNIFYAIIIFIGVGFAEFALFGLSLQYEVYEGMVSWYFPNGFRLILFIFLPLRFWPFMWIGGSIGLTLFNAHYINTSDSVSFIDLFIDHQFYLFSLPAIYLVKSLDITKYFFRVRAIFIMLLLFVVTRIIFTSLQFFINGSLYEAVPTQLKIEIFVAHQLSALLPFLYMLTGVYLVLWLSQKNQKTFSRKNFKLLFLNILITGFFVALHIIQPSLDYLLKIMIFIAIVWFGATYGLGGIVSFTFIINSLILWRLFDINDGSLLLTYMPFVLSYCLVALFVGGYIVEAGKIKQQLVDKNKKLEQSNTRLQILSNRTITIQEQERKKLSQELHDEIGQNITALKTELAIIERSNKPLASSYQTDGVRHAADLIYDSVYSLMNWLRPSILDDVGLSKALTGDFFSARLNPANIKYECKLNTDLRILRPEQEIAVFRIVQESVTNSIKYSDANKFCVSIKSADNKIIMTLSDDGIGYKSISKSHKGGFGLTGIEDRVIALGGSFMLDASNGFSLDINFPL